MATTTSQQQHRYQDYTGLPEISQPHNSNSATSNNQSAPSRRRDYLMSQANKHSSRQTMTTVGSSSRGLSADSSGVDRRIRLLDGSNANSNNTNNNNNPRQHEERERQRRAEENAAFVKMLEEESFMLQGGRFPPKNNSKDRVDRSRSTGSGDYDRYRDGRGPAFTNNYNNTFAASTQQGARPAQRYSQRQQQSPQQQAYHPHHLYSPYHHKHQEEEEEEDDEALEDRRSSHHDRDIPLELTIPTNHRNPPQQEQLPQQQQEYSLNMNLDDMRNVNPNGEDRRHPDQLRLMKRQSKSRSLSPGHSPVNNNRRHTPPPAAAIVNEQQEFEPPPNLMSLEEAILNLEMEENGQLPPQHHTPLPPRRDLPHEYDAILTGGKDHRHGQPSPHRQSHRREDNRHYHPSQQEIVAHNGNHYPHPHHPPHHHARHPHHHEQGQPRTTYDQPPARLPAEPPARLQAPVEFVEFPVGWDGREIETTQDDELLDRDEDEYYRRRAAHRLREQQAQQQSLQSLQSQSLQSQSIQSQSRTSRQTPRPGPVRRAQSNVSNDSFLGAAGAGASDMYSQNVALSGRRAPMQMIEVSPGVSMPFRGSEETWEAIALNRIVRTECLGCSIQLYCVEDAELVVCPDCQTMSPAHKTEDPQAKRTGLGLGFKEEQLVQWRNAGP